MKITPIFVPVCCLLLNGCAILSRDHQLTAVRQFPPTDLKPSVCIDAVDATLLTHGREISVEGDLSGVPIYTTRDALCEAFVNSGLFSSALRVNPAADYTVSLKSATEVEDRYLAHTLLFICTLGIFPIDDLRTYQLTAQITDNKSGAKRTVSIQETANYWYDTLLLPVGIFIKMSETSQGIRNDLNDNMALAVHTAIQDLPRPAAGTAIHTPPPAAVKPAHPVASPATVTLRLTPPELPTAVPVTSPASTSAAPPAASSGLWPELVIKGTFVSGNKTLVLLGDGLTLETGTTAPNGVRLLEAAPDWVRVSYHGQTRIYRRSGGAFFAYTHEAADTRPDQP